MRCNDRSPKRGHCQDAAPETPPDRGGCGDRRPPAGTDNRCQRNRRTSTSVVSTAVCRSAREACGASLLHTGVASDTGTHGSAPAGARHISLPSRPLTLPVVTPISLKPHDRYSPWAARDSSNASRCTCRPSASTDRHSAVTIARPIPFRCCSGATSMLTSITASGSRRSAPYPTTAPSTSATMLANFGLVITAMAAATPPSRTAARNGVSPQEASTETNRAASCPRSSACSARSEKRGSPGTYSVSAHRSTSGGCTRCPGEPSPLRQHPDKHTTVRADTGRTDTIGS